MEKNLTCYFATFLSYNATKKLPDKSGDLYGVLHFTTFFPAHANIYMCKYIYTWMFMCVHMILPEPFQSLLHAWCSFPWNISVKISKTKDLLLFNHTIIIKVKQSTWILYSYLMYRPYSNFANCPNNVLYSKRQFQISTHLVVPSL